MNGRLVHTGQVVIDLVMRVEAMPPVGGDILASDFQQFVGGGFNVMAAAARSGADVVYAGSHGTGRFDPGVRETMAAEGIVLAHKATAEDTGVCFVILDASGERTFITSPGAEGVVRPVPLQPSDILYVTGYSLTHEVNRAALIEWLPQVGDARVLLDPSPLAADVPLDVWRALAPHVDILSCNATEAKALSEVDFPIRVLRDGAKGCVLIRDGVELRIPGFPVDPVDTNGAGDTHCGVLAAELLLGNTLETAALRANAAAAISVTRFGPATAPTWSEVNELVQSR
ncbi:PfkB family carbohydrate kinase [Actinocrispum sp. NPDC049592]|uniref:PfkB family carbohydrate kinase n=1 Tax=Actinocrispum sp. NPDC049592 TaxID=3154835 RepID=UPI003442BFC4